MKIVAYKVPLVNFSRENNLEAWLSEVVSVLSEKDILVISGKVISILTGRVSFENLDLLIKQESEKQYGKGEFILTQKNGRLIPNAGIDASNIEKGWVLWPKDPQRISEQIWEFLRIKHQVKNLGIIITDSNIMPLRRGTTGIGIGWCGFEALKDYRGSKDLFGRLLKVSVANILDSLASSAVLMMGEGNEQQPLVLIKDAPVVFQNRVPNELEKKMLQINEDEDLFQYYNKS